MYSSCCFFLPSATSCAEFAFQKEVSPFCIVEERGRSNEQRIGARHLLPRCDKKNPVPVTWRDMSWASELIYKGKEKEAGSQLITPFF